MGSLTTIKSWDLKELYLVWICVIHFLHNGIFVIIPVATSKFFGPRDFPAIYGLIYLIGVILFNLAFKLN